MLEYSRENEYYSENRLLKRETNSQGNTIRYEYDPFQRMTAYEASRKRYQIEYQKNPIKPDPYNIQELDDLADVFTYSNNEKVTYQYDQLGRLVTVSGDKIGPVTYSYSTDSQGETNTVSYPNGTCMTQRVNAFGQTVQTLHNDGWMENNEYDAFGNVTAKSGNEGYQRYTYDKLDRILTEDSDSQAGRVTYAYDELGNRKTVTGAKFPLPTEERRYQYDTLNRLSEVKQGSQTTSYTYYPNGLRASKADSTGTTKYVYLNGQVIEELDENGVVKAQNVYGKGLVSRNDVQTGQKGYYLFNSHGDVSKIVEAKSGKVLNQYAYDIWGNPSTNTVSMEQMNNPFRYAGEPFDPETGMYYLRARYYDPTVGRFISEDTYKGQVDNPLTLNRYTYVHNNPLRFVDPTGHVAAEGTGSFFGGNHADLVLSWGDKAVTYADAQKLDYDEAVNTIVPAEIRQEVHEVVYQIGATRTNQTVGDVPDLGLAAPVVGTAAAATTKNAGKTVNTETVDTTVASAVKKNRSAPTDIGIPNSTKVDRDANGNITKYTTYGPDGKIVKEVRIDGKDHGSIPRPNVKEPTFNTNPKTGQKFQNGYKVRPANPGEIPNSRK